MGFQKKNNRLIKKVENNITIIIPSRKFDENLKNCIKKIRTYYKKIQIIIILDTPTKLKLDKNTKTIISGNKTIGFKRNLAAKYVKTKFSKSKIIKPKSSRQDSKEMYIYCRK